MTTVSSGQSLTISAAQMSSGVVVLSSGLLDVLSGGTAISTTVSGGVEQLDGGVASLTTVSSSGSQLVFSGGKAISATIIGSSFSGSEQDIFSGGVASFTAVNGGQQYVSSGATAVGTVVSNFGYEGVDGGTASLTTVDTGSFQNTFLGGTAISTTVSSGGQANIASGGVASGATVDSGGVMVVYSGGTASGTVVSSGGALVVLPGATDNALNAQAGSVIVSSGVTIFSFSSQESTATLVSGPVATLSGIATSGGELVLVLPGGTVSNGIINTGAEIAVATGGIAVGTTVSSGARALIGGAIDTGGRGTPGGVDSNSTILGGGLESVADGGVASSTTVDSAGRLTVSSGGSATSTTISRGGTEIVSLGGTTRATVISGGTLDVQSGGLVSGSVTFAGISGTLQIDGTSMPTGTISGFVGDRGNTIDLTNIAFDSGGSVTLGANNQLQITEGGATYNLQLDPAQNFTRDFFHLTSDGSGGTRVTESGLINLVYDAQALAAPQSFRDGMQAAADLLDAAIQNNIVVNIEVGYGEFNGTDLVTLGYNQNTSLGDIGYQGVEGAGCDETYSELRGLLASHETSSADIASVNALPTTTTLNGVSDFVIGSAEAKALGVLSGTDGSIDGLIGMGTNFTGSVLIGGALHEITHAMGRIPGDTALSLFRYTSSGSHDFGGGPPAAASYFSIDGGVTKLADFGVRSDPSDFLNSSPLTPNDPFDERIAGSTLTSEDLTLMDVLGFQVTPTNYTVNAGQTITGTIIYSGDKEFVQSGGNSVATYALGGGLEIISAGGADQSAAMSSGAEQDVFGSASTVVVNGGLQVVEAGGTAFGITVSAGGTQTVSAGGFTSSTTIASGGTELVSSGGTTFNPAINDSGAVLELLSSAVVSGGITFGGGGGQLQIHGSAMPGNTISGLVPGDTIDLASIAFNSAGSISVQPGNVLPINENGSSVSLNLDPNQSFAGDTFHLAPDSGSGTLITEAAAPPPPTALTLSPDSDSGVQGDYITNVTQPVITGIGEAGDTVNLFDGSTVVGSATVGGDGSWSITPTNFLAPGVHSLTASETDIAGNPSTASAPLSLTIKTSAPPMLSGLVVSPSSDGSAPVITGMGEVGDTVTLYADGAYDGTMPAGTGTVAADGTWSVITAPMSVGAHSLFAIETDLAGNTSTNSAPVPITIATVPSGPDGPSPNWPSDTTISEGVIEIKSGESAGLITFSGGGTLQLDDSASFTGKISGFAVPDQLDLRDISFGSGTTINFAEFEDNTQGILSVSDGAHVVQIVMAGQYVTGQFNPAGDGHGGTVIADPPLTASQTNPTGNTGAASPAAIAAQPPAIFVPAGDAMVTAQSGPEVFDFSNLTCGHDTIAGFAPTQDAIRLNHTQVNSFASVQAAMTTVGNATVITFDASHSLILDGVAPASLGAANFRFA